MYVEETLNTAHRHRTLVASAFVSHSTHLDPPRHEPDNYSVVDHCLGRLQCATETILWGPSQTAGHTLMIQLRWYSFTLLQSCFQQGELWVWQSPRWNKMQQPVRDRGISRGQRASNTGGEHGQKYSTTHHYQEEFSWESKENAHTKNFYILNNGKA